MKKKNEENWLDHSRREFENKKKNNPIIKTEFEVLEVTPSKKKYQGDGHGGSEPYWTPTEAVVVKNGFKTKKAAEAWMEEFEPDIGNHFSIRQQNLRVFTEQRWVTW